MAEALGMEDDAERYWRLAEKVKDGVNTYLWSGLSKCYEIKNYLKTCAYER